ncbi:Dipeptidyl aminopeptidase/acylaminoacyl peptidase [Chitinophaga sp. YR573]|uniref:S9 family peptidase n=1 Tax=Chitinophaga sp. YR573 TaxID=1881040 RepID=UPI0008C44D88|nr:prolyl oligopeptidase family serine peptidase [Chitinophaga sp. YR573]SEW21279.1 Dipeptidyl aminopeptidase/acylaminoacyl peptidase [Chitinophaga sp. YR573]
MKVTFFRNTLLIIFTIFNLTVFSQKRAIDSAYYNWPDLRPPKISPNGNYIMYEIHNYPVNMSTLIIKSLTSSWEKSIVSLDFHFYEAEITNSKAVFLKGNDSLGVIELGKSEEYYLGNTSFKVSEHNGKTWIASLKGNSLSLIGGRGNATLFNIIDYYFVDEGKKLLVQGSDTLSGNAKQFFSLLDLTSMKVEKIWSGEKASSLTFNKKSNLMVCLVTTSELVSPLKRFLFFNFSNKDSFSVSNNRYPDYEISGIMSFTRNDDNVIVKLKEIGRDEPKRKPNKLNLTIWNYKDEVIQSVQKEQIEPDEYRASVNIQRHTLTRIQEKNDRWNDILPVSSAGKSVLVNQSFGDCYYQEIAWNPACKKDWYLVNLTDGHRRRLTKIETINPFNDYRLSPDGKYVIYYDRDSLAYFSYSIFTDSLIRLTNSSSKFIYNTQMPSYFPDFQRGIAGWSKDIKSVYIYDAYDIWKFDLSGSRTPQNITGGYGAKDSIVFTMISTNGYIIEDRNVILSALNINNKDNGFYSVDLKHNTNPKVLTMGPFIYYLPFYQADENGGLKPVKASEKDIYIVKRESSDVFPNYYSTRNFIDFNKITDLAPERNYLWYKTELHSYTLPDGKLVKGVLYKPENFDSTKKYPMIVYIYEKLSNSLHGYIPPEPICNGCDVNPAVIVNNGYLLFKPDIYYKPNQTGENALQTVESAIAHFKNYTWVDTDNIGLQGCSFGGYEANYILTHSNSFKAICAASSLTDMISYGSNHFSSVYTSFTWGQMRMDKLIWEDPIAFVKVSPIFSVDKISTPLLLFHTTVDDACPFEQARELYLMMRRLKKEVWLLEYGDGNHGIFDPEQVKDFSTRMLQFFNFYLKKGPCPIWMKNGIKAKDARYERGLEY